MTAPTPTISPELTKLLRQVKLGQCLHTLPERLALANTNSLPHAEFLELILADEVARRESTSAGRRAKAAHLDPDMTLQSWDPDTAVTYDRATWNELCSLRFVDAGHNALIMGPSISGTSLRSSATRHRQTRGPFEFAAQKDPKPSLVQPCRPWPTGACRSQNYPPGDAAKPG